MIADMVVDEKIWENTNNLININLIVELET